MAYYIIQYVIKVLFLPREFAIDRREQWKYLFYVRNMNSNHTSIVYITGVKIILECFLLFFLFFLS